MKKVTIAISSFVAGALLMIPLSSFAAPAYEKIQAYINNEVRLKLNGEEIKTEYPILTYNGRTYIYLKEIGQMVGASVDWNDEERSVEIVNHLNSNSPIDGVNSEKQAENKLRDTDTNIEHSIYYNMTDVNTLLFNNRIVLEHKIINGVEYRVLNEKEVPVLGENNIFYDPYNGTYFYPKVLLLHFFEQEFLDALPEYRVNKDTKRSTQILQ